MVNIRFHGEIAEEMGDSFRLSVKSVAEAIHAINVLTNNRLNKYLFKNKHKKYQVLINGQSADTKPIEIKGDQIVETIRNSELCLRKRIESIDILPYFELHDSDVLGIVLGAVLIIAGILLLPYTGPVGAALIVGGLGMIAGGVLGLLSKPPKFEDFREIGSGNKASYLFNGPQNTIGEGGPVPVGYGKLIVGSQTIAASYDIYNIPIGDVSGISDSDAVPGKSRVYAINCGSLVDVEGWSKTVTQTDLDAHRTQIISTSQAIDLSAVTNPAPEAIYQTAVLWNKTQRNVANYIQFNFQLGSANASKDATYRLHFAYWEQGGWSLGEFDVFMDNGNDSQIVHNDVDLEALIGVERKAYIIQGERELGNSGQLTINLLPTSNSNRAVLCGIEIFI